MARASLPRKPGTALFYRSSDLDEHPYEVELGDEVEFIGEGQFGLETHRGVITAIYPRKSEVRIAYLDETDWRVNGDAKRKVSRVAVAIVDLIARVM